MSPSKNAYPKLHNAAWPGLVGKGEGSEPPISLDKMIELTTAAEVDGVVLQRLPFHHQPVALRLFDRAVQLEAVKAF